MDATKNVIHEWVHNVDCDDSYEQEIYEVALDETVVKIDGDRFWLITAVDPNTNQILLTQLDTSRTVVLIAWFLETLRVDDEVENETFLVDGGPWLHAALEQLGLEYRHETHGNRNVVEHIYNGVQRRTSMFENTFRKANPGTAEKWLQA